MKIQRLISGKRLLLRATTLILAMNVLPAMADDHGRRDNDRRDNHYRHVDNRYRDHRVPKGYIPARHGRAIYYVHRGHFYRHTDTGFISIGLPFGAIVATLPGGHVSVTIGGLPYFMADGVYYRPYRTGGYQVVTPPLVPVAPISVPAPAPTSSVMVSVSALNVRSGPGGNFSVVGEVFNGDNLVVHGTAPGWYYVQLSNGQYGWVMIRYVSPMQVAPEG